MKLYARAKINWGLNILGTRPDGYHELDTIMQSIELYDTITIEKAEKISVICPGIKGENIAAKAAKKFFAYTQIESGANIVIEKRIPIEAGLGGGSADAAAVLIALDRLYNTQLGIRLYEIARKTGADVPFCMQGGTARAKGIGEELEKLSLPKSFALCLIKPRQGLSTKEIFSCYDREGGDHPNIDMLKRGITEGDLRKIASGIGNSLEISAKKFCPQIWEAQKMLREMGAVIIGMTGSGPTMFGILHSSEIQPCHMKGFMMISTKTSDLGIQMIQE